MQQKQQQNESLTIPEDTKDGAEEQARPVCIAYIHFLLFCINKSCRTWVHRDRPTRRADRQTVRSSVRGMLYPQKCLGASPSCNQQQHNIEISIYVHLWTVIVEERRNNQPTFKMYLTDRMTVH